MYFYFQERDIRSRASLARESALLKESKQAQVDFKINVTNLSNSFFWSTSRQSLTGKFEFSNDFRRFRRFLFCIDKNSRSTHNLDREKREKSRQRLPRQDSNCANFEDSIHSNKSNQKIKSNDHNRQSIWQDFSPDVVDLKSGDIWQFRKQIWLFFRETKSITLSDFCLHFLELLHF